MAKNSPIIVEGYAFYTAADAALAESERKKVEYLRTHIKTSEPDTVFAVYKKAVEDRLFKTPIGTDFLKEMQVFLIEQCDYAPEEVPPITLYTEFDKQLRTSAQDTRQRISKPKKKERVAPLFISVVFNIVLVAAVIAMFVITLKSDNPNILNYEQNLLNRYSYWEQELTDKQQELRQKEAELKEREAAVTEAEAELSK